MNVLALIPTIFLAPRCNHTDYGHIKLLGFWFDLARTNCSHVILRSFKSISEKLSTPHFCLTDLGG